MTDSHASEAKMSSTFRVGKRWTCTMTADLAAWPSPVGCEWSPDLPRRLKQHELQDYRRGRDAFAAELALHLGGPALVVEPGSNATRLTVAAGLETAGAA